MSKHPDLNGTALALLRALDRGEVRGIRVLSERAAGRPLCGAADLDVMREYLGETRNLIDTQNFRFMLISSMIIVNTALQVAPHGPNTRERFELASRVGGGG